MADRLLSLAAGTVPELSPVETVRVAAEAGWPATGVWFDAESWTGRTTTEVVRAREDSGISVLDLEPIFVTPSGDHGDRLVDTAAAIGARNVLLVGLGVDQATMIERLSALGPRAESAGVTVAVEFGPLFATPDLATAVATVEGAGRTGLGVLVDALHLARSGGSPHDVGVIDPALLPYVQLCDATAEPISDLRTDALDDRLLPGDGDLPIEGLLTSIPAGVDVSVELRSADLRTRLTPADRARTVLSATRRVLSARRDP